VGRRGFSKARWISVLLTWSLCVALESPLAGQSSEPGSNGTTLLDRPALLDIDEMSLGSALESLQRTSGVSLSFSPDVVPVDRLTACACRTRTVGQALTILLEGTQLEVRAGRNQVLIGRARTDSSPSATLTGRVMDASTGRGLSAVEVSPVGAGAGVLTGPDGRFQIRGLPAGQREVGISAFGFEDRIVDVDLRNGGNAPLVVELTQIPFSLAELVISPGSYGILEASPATTGIAVTREDIEATPQIGDDVFRTLKRMPGVSTDDISTRLNVRGGTDRDLLVRLDGLELYEPYHLRDFDGALGIIDVQTLGGVDLITGGFPVEYGDKTAGVFDMRTRSAPAEGTRTTLGLSLSSISASSQGNFANGRGQWLTSIRRGFLEYILATTGVDDEIDPRYWDALGRIQYLVGDDHMIAGEVLFAGDQMGWTDDKTGSRIDSDWSNGYAWITWNGTFADRLRATTILSGGGLSRDRKGTASNPNRGAFTPLSATVSDVADFTFLGIKQDWQADLSSRFLLKFGGDVRWNDGDYGYESALSRYDIDENNRLFVQHDSTAASTAPSGSEVGAYLALRSRVGERLTWEAGVRYDRWSHLGTDALAPRLLTRLDLGEDTNLRASLGRYYQSQGLHELDVPDGDLQFSPPERVDQVALGIERRMGRGFTLRLDEYLKEIDDPRPIWVNLSREVNPLFEVESDRFRVTPEQSRTKGLEAVLSRDGAGFGATGLAATAWSVSYALSRAEDRVDGRWAPRTLDQTHALNVHFAVPLGADWQISGSWQYHTGWPFTEQQLDLAVVDSEDGSQEVQVLRRGFGPINAERLPDYHRLDLRTTRAFRFERSTLEVYLDVFNVYDRVNLRGYEWFLQERAGAFRAARDAGEEQLPRLPTLGVRWVF